MSSRVDTPRVANPVPPVSRSVVFAALPPVPPLTAPTAVTAKVIVLDDDPTGTQTVHGIPVLTEWSVDTLVAELRDPAPGFFILTNTRAFPEEEACAINREIGGNLMAAARTTGRRFVVMSRGDSTLRGHYPAETDALTEALGGFDVTLIVPAFFEGGRYTINDIHYVADGPRMIPVGETEFARDAAFGFHSSNLRDWVAEKSGRKISADSIFSIAIGEIRTGGVAPVASRLRAVPYGGVAIANASAPTDLRILAEALNCIESEGRKILCRTAASLVSARLGIVAPKSLSAADIVQEWQGGGLVVVGSHVGKTTVQLNTLFKDIDLPRVELSVSRVLDPVAREMEIARVGAELNAHLARKETVVLYTSRHLSPSDSAAQSLEQGKVISDGVIAAVSGITARPRWLIAKGGITSSDIATKALRIRRALVLGQALPGVPVWKTGPESRWPGLGFIIFPGNVGGAQSLSELVQMLL